MIFPGLEVSSAEGNQGNFFFVIGVSYWYQDVPPKNEVSCGEFAEAVLQV